MPLSIFCPYPDEPVPKTVRLRLDCDGEAHGLLGPSAPFESDLGYIAARTLAHRRGWTVEPEGTVLGPCCSGKRADAAQAK